MAPKQAAGHPAAGKKASSKKGASKKPACNRAPAPASKDVAAAAGDPNTDALAVISEQESQVEQKFDDREDIPAAQPDLQQEDAPDGQVDRRPVSRAQMYVFKKFLGELDEPTQKEWAELSKAGGNIGKQTRKNEIVNAHVSRGSSYRAGLSVKSLTLKKIIKCTDMQSQEVMDVGIPKAAMKAKLPGELFQEAMDDGDVWQDAEDGLWYMRSKKKARKITFNEVQEGEKLSDVKDEAAFRCLAADMKGKQFSWSSWVLSDVPRNPASSQASSSEVRTTPQFANAELMAALQDSFDATTWLTMHVKRAGHELMSSASVTKSGADMVHTGVQLCRDLVEPMGEVEMLLVRRPENIHYSEGLESLKKAAVPFDKLMVFYQEIMMLHKMYVLKDQTAKQSQKDEE